MEEAELKRRIRQLKSLEQKLLYGENSTPGNSKKHGPSMGKIPLLWDEYFDLSGKGQRKVRYSLKELLSLDREAYRSVVNEFLFQVYYRSCQDKGLANYNLYDPELLRQLGLPYDADDCAVKKRFRELAKQYHPDAGGEGEEFIRLMELYQSMKKTNE